MPWENSFANSFLGTTPYLTQYAVRRKTSTTVPISLPAAGYSTSLENSPYGYSTSTVRWKLAGMLSPSLHVFTRGNTNYSGEERLPVEGSIKFDTFRPIRSFLLLSEANRET